MPRSHPTPRFRLALLASAFGAAAILSPGTPEARIAQNKLAANKLAANKLASNKLASNRLASNRLAQNRLAQNKLASNKLASNKLASNRLAQNGLTSIRLEADAAAAELLATEDGREVYSYIVSCALPEIMTVEALVPGALDTDPGSTYSCVDEVCSFPGSLGLASYWADRKLDPRGQRWVSACLLARVNAHEISESISLRGLAPELSVTEDEAQTMTLQEGAFFGNLFTDDDGPLDWYACRGGDQAVFEYAGLAHRDCTEEDADHPGFTLCGFRYAGNCADFTLDAASPWSCRSFEAEDGTYGDCHAESGEGHWPGLRPYREIITVYVAE